MYLLNDKHHGIYPWNNNLMSEGLCSRLMYKDYRGMDSYSETIWWITPIHNNSSGWTNWNFKTICVIKLREVEEFNDDERQ